MAALFNAHVESQVVCACAYAHTPCIAVGVTVTKMVCTVGAQIGCNAGSEHALHTSYD